MTPRSRLFLTFSLVAAVLVGAALNPSTVRAAYTQALQVLKGTSTAPVIDTTAAGTITLGGTNATSVAVSMANTTTGTSMSVTSSALTSGESVKIIGSAPATMTSAGSFLKVNDGTTNVLRIGQNGVLISSQTTVPTVASTGDGATGACSNCTDTRGVATDTTAANTNPIVITFNTTRVPIACTISPGNANTAVDLKAAGGGVLTLGAGTLSISSPSANWAANAKSINYICFY